VYLEGAAWDPAARRLVRQPPGQLVQELPLLQLLPSEAGRGAGGGAFAAPVYVTQARRDAMGRGLVFEAALDTDEHPSHWVLAGVALVLNVDR
jgi:dynein heavy chain